MVEEKKEVTNDETEALKTDKTDTSENEEQTEIKTDSKPEAASEDTKPKEVKEEVKETKPDTEKTEEKTSPEPLKKKKVNQMTLVEIDAQLKMVQENMGGIQSKYAQQLLRRKEYLVSNK